jgi:hypothetical protein
MKKLRPIIAPCIWVQYFCKTFWRTHIFTNHLTEIMKHSALKIPWNWLHFCVATARLLLLKILAVAWIVIGHPVKLLDIWIWKHSVLCVDESPNNIGRCKTSFTWQSFRKNGAATAISEKITTNFLRLEISPIFSKGTWNWYVSHDLRTGTTTTWLVYIQFSSTTSTSSTHL